VHRLTVATDFTVSAVMPRVAATPFPAQATDRYLETELAVQGIPGLSPAARHRGPGTGAHGLCRALRVLGSLKCAR